MLNQSKKIGLGGVIRDADGEVDVAICLNQFVVQWLEVAEALALRKIMQICEDLDMIRVIFEGNCLLVVKAATKE